MKLFDNFVHYLTGVVLPSILLSHGVHCRLENIHPETGEWIQSEDFWVGAEHVVRQAGHKAHHSIMPEWRKLRAAEPELFHTLRVWQQPCATMDAVVWRWQAELEATEYRQLLRITDCCPASWSKQSKEAGFLLNQLQAPVAASCTPLQQPTDTHFAKPAKDAGRQEKERLRELMRIACRQLGQPVKYVSTKKELLQVSQAMHDRMVSLNNSSDTVLQACRAGGWFAYRPDETGDLHRADRQEWAQAHPQAAGRVSVAQLAGRYDWLDEQGKPQIQQPDWAQNQNEAEDLPVKPVFQPGEDVDLQAEPAELLTLADYELAVAALTHPEHRADSTLQKQVEGLGMYQAVIRKREQVLSTPQKKDTPAAKRKAATKAASNKRQAGSVKQVRALRRDLAAGFQEKIKQAGSVENRLQLLTPKVKGKPGSDEKKRKKGSKAKAARKAAKKALKLKLGCLAKNKHWLARQARKKARQKLEAKAEAKGALKLGEAGGSLTGKAVRCVAFSLTDLIRNSPGKVLDHYSTGLVTVQTASGTVRSFRQEEVYELTGSEQLALPDKTPHCNKATEQQKTRALQAVGAELQTDLTAKSQLETPELAAAWHELCFRASQAGDLDPPALAVCWNPVLLNHWVDQWQISPGSPESQLNQVMAREAVKALLDEPRKAGFCQAIVTAGGHHSLLTFCRQEAPAGQEFPNRLAVVYRDSLNRPTGSKACRRRAQRTLDFAFAVFGPAELAQTGVPALSASAKQSDVHSCGYFVMNCIEEDYRQLRGEGVYRLPESFTYKAISLNRWNKAVLSAGVKAKAKALAAGAKAAGAIAAPVPLMDLTTGCPPPQSSSSSSASAIPGSEPAPLPAPAALPKPAGPPINQSDIWGCGRCKGRITGCDRCNPAKVAQAVEKAKAKKAAQAGE